MTDEKREFLIRLEKTNNPFNPQVCKDCGGDCCKTQSCFAMPWDIDPFTAENIWYLLEKGFYSIRAFFELGKAYAFLEAREVGHGPFAVLTSHARCSHLGEEGCWFFNQERPSGGIALIPGPHCESVLELEEFEKSWKDPEVVKVMAKVLKKYIMNHSLEKVSESLFRAFEASIKNGTCSYNFISKYAIYHDGLKFGFQFEEGIYDRLFD